MKTPKKNPSFNCSWIKLVYILVNFEMFIPSLSQGLPVEYLDDLSKNTVKIFTRSTRGNM
jgi:hypothetical protein